MEELLSSLKEMRNKVAAHVIGLWAVVLSAGSAFAEAKVRTIIHEDGSRTVSSQNADSRELVEFIYDVRQIVVQKKRFLLDDLARPIQGVIFDGHGDLKARVEFGFDTLGRMVEERTYDAKGRVVRRIIYTYNALGVRSQPMAFNFDVVNPERGPTRIAPDQVQPAISNPEFNGGTTRRGDRVFEGEVEADRVSIRPRLPGSR